MTSSTIWYTFLNVALDIIETSFVNTIDVAVSNITQAFGAKMTYCGVVNALTVLITDALLNSELKV